MRRLLLFMLLTAMLASGPRTARGEIEYDFLPDQVYAEREGVPLKADLYVPQGAGPFPAMIVVHGGAWATGTKEQLAGVAKALAGLGYTTAAISYRLAPQHQFPAQIYDCQAAVRWLRANAAKYRADPAHIGGYGYSAGGELVALLGALDDDDAVREPGLTADVPSARLQVVIAGGAPCDFGPLPADSQMLAYWIGGSRAEKPQAYYDASPINFITSDDPPMFFFHGSGDLLVPKRSPEKMVAALQRAGIEAEFCEIPGADHMTAIGDRPTMQQALAFIARHLSPAAKSDPPAPSASASESPHGQ